MEIKVIAIAPNDGWAFIIREDKVFLLRPPYGSSDHIQASEKDVENALHFHAFEECDLGFSNPKEAIGFLKDKYVEAMKNQGIDLPSSEELRELLKYATDDILLEYLEKAEKELIPKGKLDAAGSIALDIMKLERENREIRKMAIDIIEECDEKKGEMERSGVGNTIRSIGGIPMPNNYRYTEASIWFSGYHFALLLLFFFGISLIIIGTAVFSQGTLPNVVLVGAGISMAPAAIVAALFRAFLFKEVQYQLTQPVINEIKGRLGPELAKQASNLVEEYREEIAALRALKDAGLICPYRRREMALKDFASAIDAETSEITIIGSSLKGLLQMDQYKDIAEKLRFKVDRSDVRVRFLLTHPVVADLRAGQEARRFAEIGGEIIDSLIILQNWGVPHENVRLYMGTPTCFAIKTKHRMLLNPYPYDSVSYDSPCLIVETSDDHPSYFYDEFDKSHFGAWDTNVAVRIHDYDETIRELRSSLPKYADAVSSMLEPVRALSTRSGL